MLEPRSLPPARVLINALALHPAADGARVFLESLVRGLPNAWPAASIGVIARGDADIDDERVTVIRVGRSGSGARRVADELLRLPRVIRRFAPDVVINPNESLPGGLSAPVVVVAQNLFYHCPGVGPLREGPLLARMRSRLQFTFYRRSMPRAYARAAAVVPVSKHAAKELATHAGLDLSRAHVIPCGADRLPLRPRVETVGPRRMLIVGSIAPYKRLSIAVDALASLRAEGDDYELCLVGTAWPGEVEQVLARARAARVAEHVHLPGAVAGDELAALYASAHVGLATSSCETFGIPVLEGLRAGLPHVVADEPWNEETAGEAAIRVPGGSAAALADGIRRLGHTAEWQRYSRLGRQRATQFTWEAASRRIAAVAATAVIQNS